jgi:hypothetical protein
MSTNALLGSGAIGGYQGAPLGNIGISMDPNNLMDFRQGQYLSNALYSPGGVAAISGQYGNQQAQTTGQYNLKSSQASADAQIRAAQAAAAAQEQAARTAADASKYASSQQYQLGMNQLGYKRDIFGQLMPMYTSALNALGAPGTVSGGAPNVPLPSGAFGYGGTGGGMYAPPPAGASAQDSPTYKAMMSAIGNAQYLTPPSLPDAPTLPTFNMPQFQQASLLNPQDMPVISRDLLSQQINQAQAGNTTATGTAIRNARQGLAGRGLGGTSPLAQGLTQQLQGSLIGANAQASLQAQQNAAQLNAGYAQAMNQALLQQASSVYGAQAGAAASAYGTDVSGLTNIYGTQVGGLTSMYGTESQAQQALQNQQMQALQAAYNAEVAAQANMYGSQMGLQGQIYGANLGYQGQIGAAQLAAQASQRNAILSALAGFANA